MASVYVVRHAIAEERDPDRWPDDALRPLTAEGEERFRRSARGLRTIAPTVDAVLSSPYARAWRTAEILHEEADWPIPKRTKLLEPWRSAANALALLDETRSIALVGHEPHLSHFVSLVLTGDDEKVSLELKKGGVVHLEGNILRWSATPKMLRSLA